MFIEGGARRVSSSAGKLIAVGFVCCQRRDRAAWKCALEEPKFRARALNCSLEEFFLLFRHQDPAVVSTQTTGWGAFRSLCLVPTVRESPPQ